jgi:putative protease
MSKRIELISPAGNIEKMKTAIAFGVDAVYAGIPDYSLRVRINDFNLGKIKKATKYCHKQDKKIYITLNIFAHNKHLKTLPKHVKKLREIGVDGLFVSDPGILMLVKKAWPKSNIFLSTQANCTNWQAVKFWQNQGVRRIILGREVTLEEIKEIKKKCPGIELEYFVHGAMCMSYSGRCFLSNNYLNRSANLGDCVQPCRWKFKTRLIAERSDSYKKSQDSTTMQELELVQEKHGSYILNSKDLCLIKYLDKLIEAGVTSFKIEGRAKSVYYQGVVAGAYKRALEINLSRQEKKDKEKSINKICHDLDSKLVHRGYTTGFLLDKKGEQNREESHKKSNWEFCGQVIQSKKFESKKYKVFIKVHNSLKVGDVVEIVVPIYDIIRVKVKELRDAETGEKIKEVHGGQEKIIILENKVEVLKYSVLRRRIS